MRKKQRNNSLSKGKTPMSIPLKESRRIKELKSHCGISLLFSWKPIIEYIDSKFEEYLNAESKVYRKPFADDRVHCCLYFIAPTGHW